MEPTTREEARDALRAALLQWHAEGVERPVVPVFSDLDPTGTPECFGLSPTGELIAVPFDEVFKTDEGHWERR